jgi:Tol biopolymer transport system component/tRNA A-37 threonylcarbamoyl transferase component Bud32
MAFVAGDKFGPYEVISLVGAGGMGEVYRALDPRLNRHVAIKTSTAVFSDRFEREARAVAALNHPNICTLYDVGPDYLVMEFVEGADLKGPLPLDDALRVARQVADALDAAHTRGIIHRDLKPGNIKVTPDGTVKVLDFGLAKLADADDRSAGTLVPALSQSPTMVAATQAGIILGTAAYMSPEQARGRAVDKRADIWAFGVVLYELLTGESLFQGEDVSDSLAAVIRKEPDLTRVPIEVRRLLQACLEKDPKNRLRDIGDVWRLLDTRQEETTKPARPGVVLPWVAAAIAIAGAGALAFIHFRTPAPEPRVIRFQIPAPQKATLDDAPPVLSPDGRRLAFIARSDDGQNGVWIRDFASLDDRRLSGTEGAGAPGPFWSPDSRFIGFLVRGALKKIDVSGGPPVTLSDIGAASGGGTWNGDGTILVGSPRGVWRISQSGGAATLVTKVDASKETAHAFPHFLPDDSHFIYSAGGAVFLSSLNGGAPERLIDVVSRAQYAPPLAAGHTGHLLYVRESTLMAQPLDSSTFHPVGDAFPIAEQVGSGFGGLLSFFSVSPSGALSYRTGSGVGPLQLGWFDRSGQLLGTVGRPGQYTDVAISRDGKQVVAALQDARSAAPDLWLMNTTDGVPNPLTSLPSAETAPVWSPDGLQLAFSSDRGGVYGDLNGYVKDLTGSGREELVLKSARMRDWSRDGKYLLYDNRASGGFQLWYAPLDGERKPMPFPHGPLSEAQGQFAPNPQGAGLVPRWIAYTSNETGDNEIYVRSFPPGGARSVRISPDGGSDPRWRADGKELFYISRDDRLMAVDVKAGATFEHGSPRELFKTRIRPGGPQAYALHYDVAPDGKRFLIITRPAAADVTSPPITVVMNWLAGVKK